MSDGDETNHNNSPKLPSWRFAFTQFENIFCKSNRAEKANQNVSDIAASRTAWATVVIAFVTFVVGGAQWSIQNRTLKEMRDEQRPWIGAPKIIIEGKGPQRSVTLNFKNVGKLPINGSYFDADFFDRDNGWEQRALSICKTGEKFSAADNDAFRLFAIFPDDVLVTGSFPSRRKGDQIDGPMIFDVGDPPKYIVGCAVYTWEGDPGLHRTEFLARIDSRGETFVADAVYSLRPN